MMQKNKGEDSIFDLEDSHPERAVKPDPEQAKFKKELDNALKQSFPASDPPSASQPTTNGAKKTRKKAA
ncbi:MAG: hypothetical protein ACRCYS_10310 [Beijerinckiaceae bacterium]